MIYELFTRFEENRSGQLYGKCPLHAEDTASFTVNEDTEEWYCHGCGQGGTAVEFIQRYFEVAKDTAQYVVEYYETNKLLPFPSDELIDSWHSALLNSQEDLDELAKYGITLDTITRYNIGLENNRIMIPVYNRRGDCVNVRKYLPVHRRKSIGKVAKCLNLKGLGSARYYPACNLTDDKPEVFIVEGEKDCLAAISQGYNAITSTGGSNIPTYDIEKLRGKSVYLMLDNDKVGQKATDKYLTLLRGVAEEVFVVKLPKKDFADTYAAFGDISLDEYIFPVQSSSSIALRSTDSVSSGDHGDQVVDRVAEIGDVETVSLIQSEFVDNMGAHLRLKGMSVVGTDPKIYTVPKRLRITCNNLKCGNPCPAMNSEGIEVDVDPRYLVRFVDSSDSVQYEYAKNLLGCKSVKVEPLEMTNVQKIMFQEGASFVEGLDDSTFELRYGLYAYDGYRLFPTLKYTMDTIRVTDPRSQQNYYVINKAEQERNFTLQPGMEYVKFFRDVDKRAKTFDELIAEHYEVWKPILGIEGRPDLFAAMLLTYLSLTEIRWRGGTIKGWLDTMVIGDTRTGKSQMLQRFIKQLKMGGYINGENSRKTGVVGGVQRFGDSWVVTWGAIPMNDRGLLGVDEASGLTVEDFKELSSVRSSGAVTINKIVKSEARARTRLIWISNPRSGRNLSEFYWRGYDAFCEFIPVAEDQARFDLVISAAREDITSIVGLDAPTEETYMLVDFYRALIQYAWEVRVDKAFMSSDVVKYVQSSAQNFGKMFSGGPLIVEVAVHEKILRIGFAIAVLCGDFDEEGVRLKRKHVDYALQFLTATLVKKSFGYGEFIDDSKKAFNNLDRNTQYIRTVLATHPALSILLSANQFKGSQMSEVLGLDRGEHAKLLSELLQRGLVHLGRSGYYTPDKLMVDAIKKISKDLEEG